MRTRTGCKECGLIPERNWYRCECGAEISAFASKWGHGHHTQIPSEFFSHIDALELSRTELAVIEALLKHWWKPDKFPWGSPDRFARGIGCSGRTFQRVVDGLCRNGLIEKIPGYGRRGSNGYRFDGLVRLIQTIRANCGDDGYLTDAGREVVATERKLLATGSRSPLC